MHTVGLARGDKSYDAVTEALALIRDQVTIPTDRPVLVKHPSRLSIARHV